MVKNQTCKYCAAKYPVYYHDFSDGRGYAKLHRTWDEDGEPSSAFCEIDPTVAERHPFVFWGLVLFLGLIALSAFMDYFF